MQFKLNSFLKYIISLFACNIYRFLRIFPNNDPIMGFILPFARKDSPWKVGAFAFFTMFSFDILTNHLGIWTWVTAGVYALIAIAFAVYFKKLNRIGVRTYTASAIIGVLIFDILTGPIMSSWLFAIPFSVAVTGQIPFTLMHLASAVVYTWALIPVLDPVLSHELAQRIHAWKLHFIQAFSLFQFK